MENPFELLVSGQADWDSDIIANWFVADRGFHVTERAGQAVSSGQILSLNSGGFFFPFNPNSSGAQPHGMAYTAAASGDSLSVIVWGAIRSLSINSPAIPGQLMFSNASGFLSTATLGLSIGYGLKGYGVLFNPAKPGANGTSTYSASHRVQSVQISAAQNSTHLFTMSLGLGSFGWNRRVRINGTSMTLVELKFFSDSGRTDLQYQTLSGGVSAVTSFHDRAGWPIDTDSGTVYGSIQCYSTGAATDTLNIIADWEV